MRLIVLDTETTGIDPNAGNRILEIGCVEIENRKLTGRHFHRYINPERDSEEGALRVHGITTEFFADKPKFAEIADEFLAFVRGAEIVIHNAPFDVGFLNAELKRLTLPTFDTHVRGVIDTLVEARKLFPGKRNSLDALCDRYGVSNAHRTLHGALLDSELLADVYLAMTRGQNSLVMDVLDEPLLAHGQNADALQARPLPPVTVLRASDTENQTHESYLDGIEKECKGSSLWRGAPQ